MSWRHETPYSGQLVRAMRMLHKTHATRLTPWLCATTLPLFAFSCVSLGAQESPWEGCRAASKTEYESAKKDFLLQTSVGAYAMDGPWGRRRYLAARHDTVPYALSDNLRHNKVLHERVFLLTVITERVP